MVKTTLVVYLTIYKFICFETLIIFLESAINLNEHLISKSNNNSYHDSTSGFLNVFSKKDPYHNAVEKFFLCITKINTKLLLCNSNSKNLFLQLSVWDDELLSTLTVATYLAKHYQNPMNLIHQMLFYSHYTHIVLAMFYYNSCIKQAVF